MRFNSKMRNTTHPTPVVGKQTIRRAIPSSLGFYRMSSCLLLSLIFNVSLLVLILPLRGVRSTVVLPQYNRSFTSLPGNFGGKLNEHDPPVLAHLTIIKNQPFLCPDELKHIEPQPPFYGSGEEGNIIGNDGNSNNTLPDTANSTLDEAYGGIEKLPQPEDGLPIALLVERGMCAFYDKAVMASRYGDAVKYVIVYDDQVSHDLVAMSSKFTTNITLLFVSSLSGQGTCQELFCLFLPNTMTHLFCRGFLRDAHQSAHHDAEHRPF